MRRGSSVVRWRYHVYVIELRALEVSGEREERSSPRAASRPRRAASGGPRGEKRSKPDVYVGSTALPPDQRFQKHLTHARSASHHVRKRGRCLRPDLYEGIREFDDRASARAAERRLAHRLEKQGYRVYGACSPRKTECALDDGRHRPSRLTGER